MGTSQAYDYKTGRWVLDCANCGKVGGVRKRKCPSNWCPPTQLCQPCFTEVKKEGRWTDWHENCAEHSANYKAEQEVKNSEPEQYARTAWGTWHTGTSDVLVKTLNDTYVLVPKEAYDPDGRLCEQGARAWTVSSGVSLP